MKITFSLFILMSLATLAVSQDDFAKFGINPKGTSELGGLKVGDLAPEISVDLGEERFVLSEALKDHEVLLVFYRGYWCSVCNRHLSAFEEELFLLEERGIRVIAISPEKYEYVDRMVEQTSLSVDVLSDSDGQIMKDYKVFYQVTEAYTERLNKYIGGELAAINGQQSAALPVPATYLIGKDQRIGFVHYDINYRNRASVKDIIAAIEQ